MAPPKVSIGLPVRNGELLIERALESLLQQTFQDFELIISDNDSSDRTREICLEFSKKDSRIRYFRQDTCLDAYNNFYFVLKQSASPYFMWAAHDDYWDPSFLEPLVTHMEKNQEISLCFCWFYLINDKTQQIMKEVRPTGALHEKPMTNFIVASLTLCNHFVYGLFRTPFLQKTLAEMFIYDFSDTYIYLNTALTSKISVIPTPLFFYSETPNKVRNSSDPQKPLFRFHYRKFLIQMLKSIYKSPSRFPMKLIGSFVFLIVWLRIFVSNQFKI